MSRVLVVEDESIVAMDIQNRLRHLGYDVPAVALSGEDGVEKAMALNPDLVLMDIMLKGKMDGIAAAERIQERLHIPVIYLTAHSDKDTLERVKITEPYGYLIKPFEERELHTAIEIAIYKHQMERKLKESERWLSTTLSSIGDALIATDVEGRVKFMNIVGEKLTGYREKEALGKDLAAVFRIINEKTRTVMDNPVMKVLRDGRIVGMANHTVLIARDGREIPIDDSAAPIRDDEGKISGVVMVFRDISERKQALDALRKSEQRYHLLFDSNPHPMWVYDPETLAFLEVNEAAVKQYGYTREEFLRMTAKDIRPAEEVPRYLKRIAEIKDCYGDSGVWRHIKKDGTVIDVEITAHPLTFAGRRARVLLAYNVTERKRMEDALRLSEDRYRDLVENSQDLICTHDLEGRILSLNDAAVRLIGYDGRKLLRMNIRDILFPEAREAFHNYLTGIRQDGIADGIVAVKTATGEKRIWEYHNTLRTEGVSVPIVRGMAHDITERMNAQKEMKKALSLLHATLESNKDGILAVDKNGAILTFNRRFVDMWRIPDSVIASRDVKQVQLFVSEQLADPKGFLTRLKEIYFDPEKDSYDELRFKDGRYFERFSQPQFLGNNIVGRVCNFRDVTRRKAAEDAKAALEEQVRHLQKMEAIGRLAGGIAHDFNNTLTAISGYSELLLTRMKSGDPMRREIEGIKRAGERAATLTSQLLAFSRKQILQSAVIDLNAVVTGMDKMIRRLIGEDIDLVTVLFKELGSIRTDPGQIEQIILNLAINARDAMTSGGTLTVETANVDLNEEYARAHMGVKPGRYVMLSIADTGVGMTPEVREHVFEPFFTTKEKGKGTGLGLSSVYGTVNQSGGSIWVYSEPGRGTTFKIYFPRVDELPETRPEQETDKSLRGTETILVVEDDHEVRRLIVRVLQERGYKVMEAPQGGDALLICEKYAEPIHLILTDVIMPLMNAPQLIERLRKVRQDFKVLYMSGYTDNAIIAQGVLDLSVNFIQKPFALNGLAQKIREVLSGN